MRKNDTRERCEVSHVISGCIHVINRGMPVVQMRKEMEKGTWRGQDKEAEAAKAAGLGTKPVPKPYMSVQYREDSMRTTGAVHIAAMRCWGQ